ncbi:DUF6518 family protein [Streptomyces sp. AM 2-1-1]|uniref:DUF6518 family protein n=1 Tax=Streptomyces sp. AM 2-1-1 TaxID=3028709 RepID=UPI0023B8A655|nr:DUF6518 family protein [Streptomyces sp. AM 2-1-1]WEH38034.1 DUF6518 family protein [Streptomyces sp. AM 2-1-1]WEH43505.1 DUF6518 family protein [Streptomyces sp. AM 2-1-1]
MRSSLSTVTLPLAVGLFVGVAGPLLESMDGQLSHAVSVTLVAGWMYSLLAFFAGLMAKSMKQSGVMGFASLFVTVLAYYVTKAIQGDFVAPDFSDPTGKATHFAWQDFLSMLVLWWAFALLFGSLCGFAGYYSRKAYHLGLRLACQLVVPVVIVCETTMRLSVEASRQDALVGNTWDITRMLAVAAIVALAGGTAFSARRRRAC